MRIRARLLLGLYGVVLAVPTMAVAAPFGDDDAGYAAGPAPAQAGRHHHHGLLGRRHCVECQRARAKSHDGVDVPAPPVLGPGEMIHGPVLAAQVSTCTTCQGSGSVSTSGPMMVADGSAPGYAVVDGSPMMASNAPGYAVVGGVAAGAEPSPIGVSRSGQTAMMGGGRMTAMGGRPGGYDPSVMPTAIPPAQNALAGPGHDRPRVIGHLLGIPKPGMLRREREDKERQRHAAIAYDQANGKLTELPASMVYGNK